MFFASGSLFWAGAQNARPWWEYCVAASQLIIYGKGADIGWHRMRLSVSTRNPPPAMFWRRLW